MSKLRPINRKTASLPTVRRLPAYLQVVRQAEEEGMTVISGTVIAEELDLEPIQVRKDLAVTGIVGKPRVGYVVKDLSAALEKFLRWDVAHNVILVGAGNLGSALLGHTDFRKNGMNIIAAFDSDPRKVGQKLHGIMVYDYKIIDEVIKDKNVAMAILAIPSHVAQEVATSLIALGIKSLWNFTSVKIKAPEGVKGVLIQKEDLSSGYAVLSVRS
ncbi:MAG: redox-sensing transcriptional repressor Rex [Spirochaetes bacterium GWB1_48_6]|nr:MAG: redox-sensing transcriptional repressor Rex [Spirochaetes bacterium GWB1_48_6]